MNQQDFAFPDQFQGFSFTEYLIIFVGLIFALAIAEFFLSIGQLVREWRRTKFYWEFFLWIFVLLDLFILTWYVSWVRLEFVTEGLYLFFLFTFPNLVIFLITSVFFPSLKGQGEVDLKKHFESVRPKFFWLFSVYALFNIVLDLVLSIQSAWMAVIAASIYLGLGVLNALYSRIWLRMILVVLFLIQLGVLLIILQ